MNDTMGITGAATALAEPPATDPAVKTILLLDSVEVFLRFEETILRRRDWRVLTACSGSEALDILGREKVDLLVMDHQLPDVLGEHVIRAAKSNPDLRGMAILMVTAKGDQETVERCMGEGCDGFLYKTVSRQALGAKVEQLLMVPARRHVRTLVRLSVAREGGRQACFGNTINLSAGGMMVETPVPMAVGDCMELRFHLPGDARPVVVMARVVRECTAEIGQPAWGIQFERLEEDDRARIEDFVRCAEAARARAS